MGWFLKIEKDGIDLYPKLKENFEKPGFFVSEKVRGEVMRHFGYFMTEATGHLSEYLPWFRSSKRALAEFCDEPGFGGTSGVYYKFYDYIANKYDGVLALSEEPLDLPKRSVEYGSYIIEALETGKCFHFNGNIKNNGLVDDFPVDACVEVPVYADTLGLHPEKIGKLSA